jgi:hypothetical protein
MPSSRLVSLTKSPQIQANWANFDGSQTIYITTDHALNVVTLSLTNQLGNAITLPPGTPVAYGSLQAGQSAIYIFFNGLITYEQVQAMKIAAKGPGTWLTNSFNDPSSGGYIAMAPSARVEVDNGTGIEFTLTDILASTSNSGQVVIAIQGGIGIADSQSSPQVFVSVQKAPPENNQALNLVVGFAGSDLVFTGGQANELTLFLTNPNRNPLVPGGTGSWGSDPPTFQLSLVFGDGDGALCTKALADGIAVNLGDTFGNSWKPVEKKQQGGSPTWYMQPTKTQAGGYVLGTGEHASIAFTITDIVTHLPQGLTYAYLSTRNIPGYNDGFFVIEIIKVNPINVKSFAANPPSIVDAREPTLVTLSFNVENAGYVTITNSSYGKPVKNDILNDSTGVKVYATTTFTLIATNFVTGQVLSQELTVPVTAGQPAADALVMSAITAAKVEVLETSTFKGGVTIGIPAVPASLTINGQLSSFTASINKGVGIGVGQRAPNAKLEISSDVSETESDIVLVGKGTSNYLTVQHDGPVGIGTILPKGRLHVKGHNSTSSHTDNALIIEGDSSTTAASPRLYIIDTNGKDASKNPYTVDTAPAWVLDNCQDHFRIYRQANLTTDGAGGLRITNFGDVGVYEDDPKARLHISRPYFAQGEETYFSLLIEGKAQGACYPSLALIDTSEQPVKEAPAWVMFMDDVGNFTLSRMDNITNDANSNRKLQITQNGVYFNVPIVLQNAYGNNDSNYYQLVSWNQNKNWACWQVVNPPSDLRLKKDVRPITDALDKVNRLQGALHRWNDAGLDYLTQDLVNSVSAGPDATEGQLEALRRAKREEAIAKLSGEYLGLIAQDVEAIVPEVVYQNDDGHKYIRYPQLVALLIEAVKEQTQLIALQQAAIDRLTQVHQPSAVEAAR